MNSGVFRFIFLLYPWSRAFLILPRALFLSKQAHRKGKPRVLFNQNGCKTHNFGVLDRPPGQNTYETNDSLNVGYECYDLALFLPERIDLNQASLPMPHQSTTTTNKGKALWLCMLSVISFYTTLVTKPVLELSSLELLGNIDSYVTGFARATQCHVCHTVC